MAEKVSIAPDIEDIKRTGNVFECDFDGMHIKWAVATDCSDMDETTERNLKSCLQTAIALSGKMWQVPYALNMSLGFSSEVYVDDKRVDYPTIQRR